MTPLVQRKTVLRCQDERHRRVNVAKSASQRRLDLFFPSDRFEPSIENAIEIRVKGIVDAPTAEQRVGLFSECTLSNEPLRNTVNFARHCFRAYGIERAETSLR